MAVFDLNNSEQFLSIIGQARDFLWGGPLLVALLGVGLYQTWQIRGIQFRYFAKAIKLTVIPKPDLSDSRSSGDISAFQALMTALAGAIGTGNITGIATAVAVGGFGSLFWMWVMAGFGMATAYSETILAIKYRKKNVDGNMSGGPMYSLLHGLNFKKLAWVYAFFACIAALGIGCMVQSNSVVDAVTSAYGGDKILFGIILAVATGSVVIGGVKTIGRVAGILVPFMAAIYLLAGVFILFWHYDRLSDALQLIFSSAFNGQAAVGGFLGSTIMLAMQNGAQYGIFANEAGLGTLSIAAASAKTSHPVEQGLRSIGGVFFSTMVVCTVTGLVLAVTQVLGIQSSNGVLVKGSPLAVAAFTSVYSGLSYVVVGGLVLFAFTTMLAWAYYGEKCIEYLFDLKIAYAYRWVFTIFVLIGAVLELDMVWAIANLSSALMALPNLITIVLLSKVVKEETNNYFNVSSNTWYKNIPVLI
jgi:alanine or glycine:cation symporter, AGCS family